MDPLAQKLLADALQLPEETRVDLAEALLLSVELATDLDVESLCRELFNRQDPDPESDPPLDESNGQV